MILRDYQVETVKKSVAALKKHGNTLAVAPTGAGKTIILSAVAGALGGKQCVLQHRDELVQQNRDKFHLVNPAIPTSLCTASEKDFSAPTTFAMVQTLVRNLDKMPPLDLIVIDEAHHAVTDTYQKIINAAKEQNPACRIYGVTATAARGDKKGLKPVFDNCASYISVSRLIAQGDLIEPRMFSLTLGEETDRKLADLHRTKTGEYDMLEAEEVLNTVGANELVVQEWKRLAGNRKTIVFCSTVKHAQDVATAFDRAGVLADYIDGTMPESTRRSILRDFDSQNEISTQVLCNVSVLTEGFDSQPVSCVVLLRPCCQRPTMIQMIGRGLRKVDPEKYPGVSKKDCLVLDFGNTLDTHGTSLDMNVRLDDKPVHCDFCGSEIPAGSNPCPICGADRTPEMNIGGGDGPANVQSGKLAELEFYKGSPFRWCDLFGRGRVMMASGFNSFCAVISPDDENWLAVGSCQKGALSVIGQGTKIACLASADDFFRMNEDSSAVNKNKRWQREPCSDKQWKLLAKAGYPENEKLAINKYDAACALNFQWNRSKIEGAMRRELGIRF